MREHKNVNTADKKLNALQRLRHSHPRTWAAVAFPPFVFATVVVAPISILFDFCCEIPRMAQNLWNDVYHSWRGCWRDCTRLVKSAWRDWGRAVLGNDKI